MPPAATDLPLRGIFLYVSQVVCFLVISMTVKSLAPYFAVTELLLVRFVFALLVVLAVIGPKRGSGFFKTCYPIDHMIRTCCGMVALGLSFVALSGAFIANATAVILSAPIIAVVLAFFVLREQIRPSRMIAVIIGFCGILMIV
ncbi:MAG: EamA family transporter, partial [Pseudomonadota bacterium]|nr:EamA family transporter [Pseudomonadota bacterium]